MVLFQEFEHAQGFGIRGRRLCFGILFSGSEVLGSSYGEV